MSTVSLTPDYRQPIHGKVRVFTVDFDHQMISHPHAPGMVVYHIPTDRRVTVLFEDGVEMLLKRNPDGTFSDGPIVSRTIRTPTAAPLPTPPTWASTVAPTFVSSVGIPSPSTVVVDEVLPHPDNPLPAYEPPKPPESMKVKVRKRSYKRLVR